MVSNVNINGTCEKGFESVKDMFYQNFVIGNEDNAQLCIYVGNKCVVDLYGSATGDTNYGPDKLHVINKMKSNKSYTYHITIRNNYTQHNYEN